MSFDLHEILLPAFTRAVLEGALAVAIIALLLRIFPRTPSSWAAFLWWLACGKFVLGLVPYAQAPWAVPVAVDLPPVPVSFLDRPGASVDLPDDQEELQIWSEKGEEALGG